MAKIGCVLSCQIVGDLGAGSDFKCSWLEFKAHDVVVGDDLIASGANGIEDGRIVDVSFSEISTEVGFNIVDIAEDGAIFVQAEVAICIYGDLGRSGPDVVSSIDQIVRIKFS